MGLIGPICTILPGPQRAPAMSAMVSAPVVDRPWRMRVAGTSRVARRRRVGCGPELPPGPGPVTGSGPGPGA
jgi:hypothetical protein